jgi:hypothetical protein
MCAPKQITAPDQAANLHANIEEQLNRAQDAPQTGGPRRRDTTTRQECADVEQPKASVVVLSSGRFYRPLSELHACYDYCAAWKEPTQEENRTKDIQIQRRRRSLDSHENKAHRSRAFGETR